jgi:flavin reductase (DIM6/NTAB) family NADH-FMN oxidoreductase RutF
VAERPVDQAPVEFDLPVHGGFAPAGIGETEPSDFPDAEELEIAGEPGQDPAAAFRRTLGMFATGVTVITTQVDEQVHGMTANAFMSVSLRPPLVTISVDRRARMHALLHEGRRYGISVLADEQRALSDRFAGRAVEDAGEVEFDLVHETPLVHGALAHLVARVVRSYWGGDHSLFLGQVEYARRAPGARPLLFHGGQYGRLDA